MSRPKAIDRRAFLKLAGCAGIAAGLPLVSPAIGLAGLDRRWRVAQATRMMMGTVVAVTVVDTSAARAQQALEQALARMSALSPLFDRHQGCGPVRDLNLSGRLRELDPDLERVLALCRQVHRISGGAFDITVAPVIDLYRRSFARGHRPSREQVQQALAAVGALRRDGKGLVLTRPGAAVTLDGVAKGYIADAGLAAARKAGAENVLINAGGDIVVSGHDRGRPWRVAVADPHHPQRPKVMVSLTTGALATSGNYEVYFDRQRLFHHIVNPHTGRSPHADLQASVRAPRAALADAMSTACFVLRPPAAVRLLRARGLEGLIFTRHHQRYMTPGFLA